MGNVTWHVTDHLGTVRDLVDGSGTVLNHITYDSFGNVVGESDGSVDSRYLFTGREWDEEIGLYYYRARYYDAGIGRFIGEDPIGFDGGDWNLYGYVGNSPLTRIDPFGLTSNELIQLLSVAEPRNGIGDSVYYYKGNSDYYDALIEGYNWFLVITERNIGNKGKGRISFPVNNSDIPTLKWGLNGLLKVDPSLTPGIIAGGQATFRPAGLSGIIPTIDLQPEKKTKIRHETPGHENATEIKFLWDEKDDQCPFIPPIFNPKPAVEPKLKDMRKPAPPAPAPTPTPWWEDLDFYPIFRRIPNFNRQMP